jgi:hypothetical protein
VRRCQGWREVGSLDQKTHLPVDQFADVGVGLRRSSPDAASRAARQLPRRLRAAVDDPSDFRERDGEHVVKHVRHPQTRPTIVVSHDSGLWIVSCWERPSLSHASWSESSASLTDPSMR